MTESSKTRTSIYILGEEHMRKLDELISEIQCIYCDIFSNRCLTVTSKYAGTPESAFINANSGNGQSMDDIPTK